MVESLAQALWIGSDHDVKTISQTLIDSVATETDYAKSLERLRLLSLHGLSTQNAIAKALAMWPWSIDLAHLAFETAADPVTALDQLERTVRAQDRRFATLAWAAWSLGDVARARAVLDALKPTSESYAADCAARAELAILYDEVPDRIAGPVGKRLSLLHTWRSEGAQPLRSRLAHEAAELPASPPLWSWLIDVWITERDFAQADSLMQQFETRCGASHPEVIAQKTRLFLDRGDAQNARILLSQVANPATPWLWTQRQHAQIIRCLRLEAATMVDPDYSNVIHFAKSASRLFPRNQVLRGLLEATRDLTQDWDLLATTHLANPTDPVLAATSLGRIGLQSDALSLLAKVPLPMPPDRAHWLRIRSTELHLRQGSLAKAEAALGPVPKPWPHRADHAFWTSEIALARRDLPAAHRALDPALVTGPTRMGLLLNSTRLAYFDGQFEQALTLLKQFRALKTAELGVEPRDDLRDLIVQDAAQARASGGTDLTSPGLAARVLALSPPVFSPVVDGSSIPRTLAHYWEGKRSAPVDRGIRRWAQMHPDLSQTLYGPTEAEHWLARKAPELSGLFDRLTQPATRADLFRIALMAVEGGLFADLDEYPRQPVTPWLEGARAVLVIEEGHGTVANNFLAAQPGLALFQRLQRRIATLLAATETPYAWWDCGPAQVTLEALTASRDPTEARGLRFLSQAEYNACVATNLPFPHKRGIGHWRST